MEMSIQVPEIVVWLPTALDEPSRNRLTGSLQRREGIQSAVFCPIRHHLMLVQYRRESLTSQDVLAFVRESSADAKLVGPI